MNDKIRLTQVSHALREPTGREPPGMTEPSERPKRRPAKGASIAA
jgi:hypothetical protein